jgi:hypothetical protein
MKVLCKRILNYGLSRLKEMPLMANPKLLSNVKVNIKISMLKKSQPWFYKK